MKKLLVPFLLALLLLAGCETVSLEDAENARYADHQHANLIEQNLAVGETLKLEKVTKGEGYSILYETTGGNLLWIDLDNYYNQVRYEVKKSYENYSYLVREKNLVKKGLMKGDYIATKNVVTLYLKTTELEGGSYSRDCGKYCTEEIKVEALD